MPFERLETRLDGVGLIQPTVFGDERGFFVETYRRSEFAELGIAEEMVQDNHSRSKHGIVRGMHFQIGDGAAKLVRCGRGQIVDVVVDLRRDLRRSASGRRSSSATRTAASSTARSASLTGSAS